MVGPVADKQLWKRHAAAMKLVPFVAERERMLLLAEVIWPSRRLRALQDEAAVVSQEPDRPVPPHT